MSAEPVSQRLDIQAEVIARRQGAKLGIDPDTMRNRVRNGRWQRLQRGVYAAFTGDPAREAVLWAALLRAGPGAVLSHQTAAERHGLLDEPSSVITITVPAAHPADEQWRDKRRDTDNAVKGILTLRFGLPDLGDRRCETAGAVAAVLRSRGWRGAPRHCSRPDCAVTS